MPKYEFIDGKLTASVDETNPGEKLKKLSKDLKGKKASTMTKAELVELVLLMAKKLKIEIL